MENAIEINGVCKHYKEFSLENIHLNLPVGEVMGLVGVNGAGKSTTLRILMGLVQADAGMVKVLGHSLPEAQVLAKANVGYASDDMRLYKSRDLAWHMEFIRSIFPDWDQDYAQTLLKRFDLNENQKIKGFSHGQRVKACLLLVLARKPKLVVLDEPTTGLDPVARKEVLNELAEVLLYEDRSVLYSSHITGDVEQISDTITFLDRGKILCSQDKENFLDGWRRIRCQGNVDIDKISLPGLVEIEKSGSLISIAVDKFDDALLQKVSGFGSEILGVERMSLEEIFVSSVARERKGVN